MFLPKLFIETHGITVNRVFDMPSLTHADNYVNLREFLDDFPPEVQKQLICTEKTKKFGKLLDDHYEERKGFSMEELRIELEDAGMDGGAIDHSQQELYAPLLCSC